MKHWMAVVLAAMVLGGCAKKEGAPGPATLAAPTGASQTAGARYLAYEHSLTVNTRESEVRPLYEKLVNACNADIVNQCTLLDSHMDTGREASAAIRLRVKAAGVPALTKLVAAGGELNQQSTHVEDLATPIADNDRRIAMLKNYEEQLVAIEKRPSNDIEALMKVAQEVANVQSQLEQASGDNAHMMERVALQTLNISIEPAGGSAFWAPIGAALGEFSGNLSRAIAGVVQLTAFLLPWSLLALVVVLAVRKIRRRRMANTRADSRGQGTASAD